MPDLSSLSWFRNSATEIQNQLTHLCTQPSSGEFGLAYDLVKRNELIGDLEVLSLQHILEGAYFVTLVFQVRKPSGETYSYEYVTRRGGSLSGAKLLVGLTDSLDHPPHSLLVANGPRFATGHSELICIGGFQTKGEDIESCARRELQEEAGITEAVLHSLGGIIPDTGMTNCTIQLFFALTTSFYEGEKTMTREPDQGLLQIPIAEADKLFEKSRDAVFIAALGRAKAMGFFP